MDGTAVVVTVVDETVVVAVGTVVAVVVVGTAVVVTVVDEAVVVVGASVVESAGVSLAVRGPSAEDPHPARSKINNRVLSVVRVAAASRVEVSFGHVRRIGEGAKPVLAGLSPAASAPS